MFLSCSIVRVALRGLLLGVLLGAAVACQGAGGRRAGAEDREVSAAEREIEAMLASLYRSFCFDAGAEADWTAMRAHFVEGASFASPIQNGGPANVMGVEPFLAGFRQWVTSAELSRTGFHERIVNTRIDVFQNIAHAYVTFEGYVPGSQGEEPVVQSLGLDSIQLVRDRGVWKLASFTSQYASERAPMPPQFMTPSGATN